MHFLLHKVTYSVALAALPCSTCARAPGATTEAYLRKGSSQVKSSQVNPKVRRLSKVRDSESLVRKSSQVKPSRAEGSVDSAQNARAKMMADSIDAFFYLYRNPTFVTKTPRSPPDELTYRLPTARRKQKCSRINFHSHRRFALKWSSKLPSPKCASLSSKRRGLGCRGVPSTRMKICCGCGRS